MRCLEDVEAPAHSYVRVHLGPKEYPVASSTNWSKHIAYVSEHFLVVEKPPCLPTVPNVDNIRDCLVTCAQQALGLPQAPLPMHRLDNCTSGWVVLARTPEFARYFQNVLRNDPDKVMKRYVCLVRCPPPVGPLVHYVRVGVQHCGSPKYTAVMDAVPREGSCLTEDIYRGVVRCELDVEKVKSVGLESLLLPEDQEGPWYEVEVRLKTGRTHQIRAQLAAVGCPIFGDTLYQWLSCQGVLVHRLGAPVVAERVREGEGVQGPINEPQGTSIGGTEERQVMSTGEDMEVSGGDGPGTRRGRKPGCVPPWQSYEDGSGAQTECRDPNASDLGKCLTGPCRRINWQAILGPQGSQKIALHAHRLDVSDVHEGVHAQYWTSNRVSYGPTLPWWSCPV